MDFLLVALWCNFLGLQRMTSIQHIIPGGLQRAYSIQIILNCFVLLIERHTRYSIPLPATILILLAIRCSGCHTSGKAFNILKDAFGHPLPFSFRWGIHETKSVTFFYHIGRLHAASAVSAIGQFPVIQRDSSWPTVDNRQTTSNCSTLFAALVEVLLVSHVIKHATIFKLTAK